MLVIEGVGLLIGCNLEKINQTLEIIRYHHLQSDGGELRVKTMGEMGTAVFGDLNQNKCVAKNCFTLNGLHCLWIKHQ